MIENETDQTDQIDQTDEIDEIDEIDETDQIDEFDGYPTAFARRCRTTVFNSKLRELHENASR